MARLVSLVLLAISAPTWASRGGEPAPIAGGRFAPLFGLDRGQESFEVRAFKLDRRLVTNEAYARFVAQNPRWARGKVPTSLADERYLSHWQPGANGFSPKPGYERAPVVWISWFAAEAYCEWRGGRLAETLEWEYVAAASETQRDASRDPAFVAQLLRWYAKPSREEDLLGFGSPPNVWGVAQLHGLVWEWTRDFNALFVTGDNRQDGDSMKDLFCGSGATGSARREDYAAFMRYALRSSLTARSTLGNLGFRCAYDVAPNGQ